MTPQLCQKCQSTFSAYLDGAVSGQKMQQIARHLDACANCTREFAALRAMQQSLATLGPAKAPADLGLKLRLAISHEQARRRSSWLDTLSLKWENAVRPMLVQVSAGFAGTVILVGSIGLLLGMVAAPEPVMANDEPLGAITAPHYLYSTVYPGAIITDHDSVIVVEAYVNERLPAGQRLWRPRAQPRRPHLLRNLRAWVGNQPRLKSPANVISNLRRG
jgi:hypothetical protein